jgi:hypothetical protein
MQEIFGTTNIRGIIGLPDHVGQQGSVVLGLWFLVFAS